MLATESKDSAMSSSGISSLPKEKEDGASAATGAGGTGKKSTTKYGFVIDDGSGDSDGPDGGADSNSENTIGSRELWAGAGKGSIAAPSAPSLAESTKRKSGDILVVDEGDDDAVAAKAAAQDASDAGRGGGVERQSSASPQHRRQRSPSPGSGSAPGRKQSQSPQRSSNFSPKTRKRKSIEIEGGEADAEGDASAGSPKSGRSRSPSRPSPKKGPAPIATKMVVADAEEDPAIAAEMERLRLRDEGPDGHDEDPEELIRQAQEEAIREKIEVDWGRDAHAYLQKIRGSNVVSLDTVEQKILRPLEKILKNDITAAQKGTMRLFGSFESGFAGKKSDLDISYLPEDAERFDVIGDKADILSQFAAALESPANNNGFTGFKNRNSSSSGSLARSSEAGESETVAGADGDAAGDEDELEKLRREADQSAAAGKQKPKLPVWTAITKVLSAQSPLVRATHVELGLEIEILMNNRLGVRNSGLLSAYSSIDPRVRELVLLIKAFAKNYEVLGSQDGCINSYAYVLLTLYYLVRINFLPNLQLLGTAVGMAPHMISSQKWGSHDTWDTKYFDPQRVGEPKVFRANFLPQYIWINGVQHERESVSLYTLCTGFFEFYLAFPWETHAVCLRSQ